MRRERQRRVLDEHSLELWAILGEEVAYGYTHAQIARRMGVTEATVNTYVKRIRASPRVIR